MLQGDRRRIELMSSLMLTLPGTPLIRYGEEIGMGEDLTLPEREAIRTPMQWSDHANAGFSSAPQRNLRDQSLRTVNTGTNASMWPLSDCGAINS
jgi:maltose alpha-D-glucosyltransferase/alpha-amylase